MTNTLSKDELMVSIYGVWHLWKERCRRVFQHTDIPERQLMELSRMISCFLVHIYRTHKEMKSMRQAMSLTFGSSPLPFLGRLMVMEGQILCRSAMQPKLPAALISNPLIKSGQLGTAFLGTMSKYRNITRLVSPISQSSAKNFGPIFSSFSSSFDGDGYKAGNFNDKDENYVNSTVMEAVEVRSGSDGYIIKMRDGKNLQCVHNNNSQGRHIPESAPQPAIVLRIEDGSETLLPIIVLEMPSVLLMAAIRNVHIARPTIYQVVKELIDKMGYEVKLVRVNKRIQEAYCAEMYLTKIGNQTECITFDLRPSDAINIAVRCKVPIQVHKSLAYNDGIRSVEPAKLVAASDGLLFTELDRPGGQPCIEAQEFSLVRNMLIAVIEERYKDAATWKDKLMKLRYKHKNWA